MNNNPTYCYRCGKKLKLIEINNIKVLYCKKDKLYFPYEREWIPIKLKRKETFIK